MIGYREALALVRENRWTGTGVACLLSQAVGRIVADDILAIHDSPRFDNSAMDGYAVGSESGPWTLAGEVAAGQTAGRLEAGRAVRIFTGAPIPEGTLAVIPQELATVAGSQLQGKAEAGRHIRLRGEEFQAGACIVPSGTRLNPGVLGAIAGQAITQVTTRTNPDVAILTTGSELVKAGQPIADGQIYESNGPMLESALQSLGFVTERHHVNDCIPETIVTGHDLLERCSLLLTVGGVSVGDYDFSRPAAERLRFRTCFSEVAIKPGKPVTFGVRDDGKAWFGLPGNPMSAMVTFLLLVREWLGCPLRWRSVPILEARRSGDRDEFVPAIWEPDGVRPLATIGSHAIAGWVRADGLLHVPASSTLAAGELMRFAPFDWGRQ